MSCLQTIRAVQPIVFGESFIRNIEDLIRNPIVYRIRQTNIRYSDSRKKWQSDSRSTIV